jgi:type IV pilus assembly protein PilN
MILINLLPVRAVKKAERGRQLIVLSVVLLFAAGLGNYLWYSKVEGELNAVKSSIRRTQEQIAELDKIIGQLNTVKQAMKTLREKLDVLETLKKGRSGPVKVMDEMAMILRDLPKVWITDFSETGGELSLRGQAVAYEDLSAFSKKLKASKHFRDIVIRRASQAASGTVDWEIGCKADYSS